MGADRGPPREVQPEPSPDGPWVDPGREEDEAGNLGKLKWSESSGKLRRRLWDGS